MQPGKFLITGASGFIGGRVVERLAMHDLSCVRAMIRDWSRAARVAKFPIDIVVGDILSPSDAARAMVGVTCVVHCAYNNDPESVTEGTRTLLSAALEAGVERFVYLSTTEVYGPEASGPIDESGSTEPNGRAYDDSKIQAERLCRQFQERGVSTTILRPAIVYGAYGQSWTVDTAKRLQSGLWSEFEQYGDGICNAVYVDDLVSAILLAASHPGADGATFNINGAEVVTWNEYFRRLNAAMQLPPLTRRTAAQTTRRTAVVNGVGTVIRAFVRRFEDRLMKLYLRHGIAHQVMKRVKTILDSTPSTGELDHLFGRRAQYVDRKARDILGYHPRYDLARGMSLSVQWLTRNGFIAEPAQLVDDMLEMPAPLSLGSKEHPQPLEFTH